jgi:hypothetical protein
VSALCSPSIDLKEQLKIKENEMATNRIHALFLSAQPCVLAALIGFFNSDPLITPLVTDYNNFNELKKGLRKFNIIVFDDASLKKAEIENISNALFSSY